MKLKKPIQFGTDGRAQQAHPVRTEYFGGSVPAQGYDRSSHRCRKILVTLVGLGQTILHEILGGGGLGAGRH